MFYVSELKRDLLNEEIQDINSNKYVCIDIAERLAFSEDIEKLSKVTGEGKNSIKTLEDYLLDTTNFDDRLVMNGVIFYKIDCVKAFIKEIKCESGSHIANTLRMAIISNEDFLETVEQLVNNQIDTIVEEYIERIHQFTKDLKEGREHWR